MAGTIIVILVLAAALLLGRFMRTHRARERQASKVQSSNRSAQQQMMDEALATRPRRSSDEE